MTDAKATIIAIIAAHHLFTSAEIKWVMSLGPILTANEKKRITTLHNRISEVQPVGGDVDLRSTASV